MMLGNPTGTSKIRAIGRSLTREVSTPQATRRRDRLEALRRHAGALADVYPQGHLEALREDWPE
jgi:hypothetical protein